MFSKTFATMMLAPAAAGLPIFVSARCTSPARIVAASPAAWNAAFATIQLALGAGLLFRRTARAALAGTIAWALAVWSLGEGLGGHPHRRRKPADRCAGRRVPLRAARAAHLPSAPQRPGRAARSR